MDAPLPPQSDPPLPLATAQAGAERHLFDHVYDELRNLAQARLAVVHNDATVSTTGLVHEAYLKMVGTNGDWEDRGHFMCVASRAMRQILVDRARARRALKRGGPSRPDTLRPDLAVGGGEEEEHVIEIHEALDRLSTRDADLARVVELRFFGGLEVDEAAVALGVSARTVARRWAQAKAHLRADLS